MTSKFESLLDEHSERLSRLSSPWKRFVQRTRSPFSDENHAWGAYAYGYKLAADAVANVCLENYPMRSVLYAPIFYLYRHYIELELKSMWKEHQRRGWIEEEFQNDHKIMPLWNRVKAPLFERDIISEVDEFVRDVGKSFNLLNSIDESSTYSRYPTSGNDEPHEIQFEIGEFIVAMDKIDTFFLGISAMIDQYDDYMSSMM